jgi:hypothetical protein
MGYTNYWYHKKPFDNVEWNKIRKEYDYIVENFNDVIIKDESKDRNEIRFNGIGDNEHETFLVKKSNDRKPLYEGEDTTFDFAIIFTVISIFRSWFWRVIFKKYF